MKAIAKFSLGALLCLLAVGAHAEAWAHQQAPQAQNPGSAQSAGSAQTPERGGERRPGLFGK